MAEVNSILLSVLLIGGIFLIGFAAYFLFRVAKTIESMKQEITQFNQSVVPLLEKVASFVEEAEGTLRIVSENSLEIGEAVSNIKRITNDIARVEHLVFEKIEPSLFGIASILSGIHRGAKTFIDTWRKSHP
jgi:peptidoglycan hydrolase CwlO-like protein